LSDGRPYSMEIFAPSMVHSVFTCGLPPFPGWTGVVFWAPAVTPKATARAVTARAYPVPRIVLCIVSSSQACLRCSVLYFTSRGLYMAPACLTGGSLP
jgi:hypothetical protein